MTEAFDPCGPLPTGTTVLEASAGTGKTYTIAALAARYVAEGVPLERLLLVTFTRLATGELRERVRERLVAVQRGLAGEPTDDPIVALLAKRDVADRRRRLAHAIADFDAATIATTHAFCQEVLGGLGIDGDLEPGTAFVEDIRDLRAEVVDDLYVRRFGLRDEPPAFERRQAAEIARRAIENPSTPIAPAAGPIPEMRAGLARAARAELERRKRQLAIMTFDDLLERLRTALEDPGAAARLRERYDVVLVDEFQDTDPVQWEIMRRGFGDRTLVLIGDPKQAIYSFRGADVYAYLEAARTAATRATLGVNWRSDQGLIDAYDALFAGARLGHEGIEYRTVRAAPGNAGTRLAGAPHGEPLRVRVVHRGEPGVGVYKDTVRKEPAREHIAADLAADLTALLDSGATVAGERVRPGHVAVLVPTNRTAALVRDALQDAGVPAVVNGAGSVFGTVDAREWLRLLEALERPSSPPRAKAAALTCFLGWTPERVAAAGDDDWEDVHRRLHDWARVLRERGVAALTETVTLVERLPRRVLGTADGERRLTDLRHVGQLLHAAASHEGLGPTALAGWLRRRIAEAFDEPDEERSRRLESDDEAVQVLTIHRSKGLEFPIVYVPFAWDERWVSDDPGPVLFHDTQAGDARTLDVALEGAPGHAHLAQQRLEQRGEDLRLLYVALTRARHQAVVWWAPGSGSQHSPLGRLLFARAPDGTVGSEGTSLPSDEATVARLQALADEAPGCVSVERSTRGRAVAWSGDRPAATDLAAAAFERSLDRRWRRTSYSDITAGAHEAYVTSEPEQDVVADEPDGGAPTASPVPADAAAAAASPWSEIPVSVDVGTLVHLVLEAADFAAPDLDAELAEQLAAAQARRAVDLGDPTTAVAALRAALETPLGAGFGGVRLRDVARADRLDELAFELPLAGGDAPTGRVALTAIGDVLREHLPADDPMAGYARRLADPALRRDVRGYLTGSLDLVVRLPGPRFAIFDYKTNWLAGPGEALTSWHHRPAALEAEMHRRHYGLQALLYTVALHRYLRWRLPGYAPERHLAGVGYLFLRGMTGPETPTVDGTPHGVFAWHPPEPLVLALSDALDGVAR